MSQSRLPGSVAIAVICMILALATKLIDRVLPVHSGFGAVSRYDAYILVPQKAIQVPFVVSKYVAHGAIPEFLANESFKPKVARQGISKERGRP